MFESLWSFKKCGSTNALGGTEDDALFEVNDFSSSGKNDDFSCFEDVDFFL